MDVAGLERDEPAVAAVVVDQAGSLAAFATPGASRNGGAAGRCQRVARAMIEPAVCPPTDIRTAAATRASP
jgi:hypothetical protein